MFGMGSLGRQWESLQAEGSLTSMGAPEMSPGALVKLRILGLPAERRCARTFGWVTLNYSSLGQFYSGAKSGNSSRAGLQ